MSNVNVKEFIDLIDQVLPKAIQNIHLKLQSAEWFEELANSMSEKDRLKYSFIVQDEQLAFYLRYYNKFLNEQKELQKN